jgi:hypothetical protein
MSLRPQEKAPSDAKAAERAVIGRVIEQIPIDIRRELEAVRKGGPPSADLLKRLMASLGPAIAQVFSVREDEVAILLVRDQGLMLGFAYPFNFYGDQKNLFPVSAPSIAGEALRAGKGRIDNNVSQIQHLDIYERINVKAQRPVKIQKMVSAPLLTPASRPVGVIQVSRKARSPEAAGSNFTPHDLCNLTELSNWLAPHILELLPPDC